MLLDMFGKAMLPPVVVLATPWMLGDVAASTALGDSLTFDPLVPIAFTDTWDRSWSRATGAAAVVAR